MKRFAAALRVNNFFFLLYFCNKNNNKYSLKFFTLSKNNNKNKKVSRLAILHITLWPLNLRKGL